MLEIAKGLSLPIPSARDRPAAALIMIMACFVLATPLSLLLTVPAYVMADKVSRGPWTELDLAKKLNTTSPK